MELIDAVGFAAVLLAAGGIAGLMAGLLGVGGGIVVVPVLFTVFGAFGGDDAVRMHVAVGTSLATIVATGFASARAHHRRGAIDLAVLRSWGPWVAAGVVAGTGIGSAVDGSRLAMLFAVVALLVALNMAVRMDRLIASDRLPDTPWRQMIAGAIGLVSVMTGIGGGSLTVPVLTACATPIRRAVATASAIGLVIAVPGAIGFLIAGLGQPGLPPGSIGYVNLGGCALIIPASAMAAPVGARLAHALPQGVLRLVFAGFLAVTAGKMLLDALP